MNNESKYCIQRKDLLESNQKVPVGATYMTIDKPTEYKWLTEDDFFVKVNGEWHSAESVDFDFIEPTPASVAKHTPAPWRVLDNRNSTDPDKFGHYIVDDQGYIVADMPSYNNTKPSEANARLIAAAPELLDAAQSVLATLKAMRQDDMIRGMQMVLEIAINKATK